MEKLNCRQTSAMEKPVFKTFLENSGMGKNVRRITVDRGGIASRLKSR